MAPELKILHVEDDPLDSEMVGALLRRDGLTARIDRVETMAGFQEALTQQSYALVLCDHTVPGVDSLEALRWVRQQRPEVPFVFVSGTIGEEEAIETLKLGASDYVFKQRLTRLVPAVRRALQEAEEQARRRQAEAALRAANEEAQRRAREAEERDVLLCAVTEGVEEAIFVKDRESRYLMINAAGARRLGKGRPEEVLHKTDEELLASAEAAAIRARDCEVMASGRAQAYEEVRMVGDGVRRVFLTNKVPYHDPEGKIIGVLGISHDITQRKQAEEAIRRLNETLEERVQQRTRELNEANANLQTFANTAAHDLRSPLRAISSFSGMSLDDYGAQLDETGRLYLERINQAAEQMGRLLHDLLEYSRMNQAELKLEVVSLQRAAQEAVTLLEADLRAKNAVVSVEEALPEVVGHPATVVLLINNFVSNALKFVAPGVQPHIRIRAQKSGETARQGGGGGEWVRIWVEDNGIGISAEDQKKLFGVFQRLHGKQEYPGTGLGLAIVRRGVQRMGGRVGVESEPGKGSRFWVELPSAECGVRRGMGRTGGMADGQQ